MILNSVKLPHFASSAEKRTEIFNDPKTVVISMSQHGGAPCLPLVKVGDMVKTGQLIGDTDAYVSAPIHSSVTGKVVEIRDITLVNGRTNQALVIETEGEQVISEEVVPPIINNRADFISAVRKSGSVGLGGAGFPTHVKIGYDPDKVLIDTLVVNGAECEPYITSDYREFMENADEIINGIKLLMKYLEIPRAVIGIENDKPKAIKLMSEKLSNDSNIIVKPLKSKYPQGAEKVLVYQTTGRVVMERELPMSANCLVMNSSTIAFISRYVETGLPLFKRRITLDGNVVKEPVNVIVPIGTTLREIMEFVSIESEPEMVIFGGPMMGNSIYDLDMPIMKTNNAILLFSGIKKNRPTACIRCGKCAYVCSMNLLPAALEKAYDARSASELEALHLDTCMSCGACSYICPARRNIAEKNQLAKHFVASQKNK